MLEVQNQFVEVFWYRIELCFGNQIISYENLSHNLPCKWKDDFSFSQNALWLKEHC